MELGNCFLLVKVELKSYILVQSFQKSALLVNGFAKDLSVLLLHQCSRRNHCLNSHFQHHQYTVKGGLGQKAVYKPSACQCHDALTMSIALQTSDCNHIHVLAFEKQSRCLGNSCCAKLRYHPLNNCIRLLIITQPPVKGFT